MSAVREVSAETPAVAAARRIPSAMRLLRLHGRSRRFPAAVAALAACGMTLWAALQFHWWYGTGNRSDELPTLLEGCAAAIIGVTAHSPFGETEKAAPRWLPFLRPAVAAGLCGAGIGLLAAGAAVAYSPATGAGLLHGMLPVYRNLLGFTGITLALSVVTGGLLSWTGPLAWVAVCQFAAIANYSEPVTWASRPPEDRGAWIAAMAVFVLGLAVYTVRGVRIQPAGD